MRKQIFPLVMAAAIGIGAAACGEGQGPALPTAPTGLSVGATRALVDLPPLTQNSCPSDAPTGFTVQVQHPVNGLYPFLFDFRRTGPSNTYVLEVRQREVNTMLPAKLMTLEARENGTTPVRYLAPGIYHFRLRGNCGAPFLWSPEVVKNGGLSAMPDVEPPPPPPPPAEEPEGQSCVSECD